MVVRKHAGVYAQRQARRWNQDAVVVFGST
jgi:hypothetical protein